MWQFKNEICNISSLNVKKHLVIPNVSSMSNPEKCNHWFKVTAHLIWLNVALTSWKHRMLCQKVSTCVWWVWLNIRWIRLQTLQTSPWTFLLESWQIVFHWQQWLFDNKDNKLPWPHLNARYHRTRTVFIVLTQRPLAAEVPYFALNMIQLLTKMWNSLF